jgi:ERCC4-type nuclease
MVHSQTRNKSERVQYDPQSSSITSTDSLDEYVGYIGDGSNLEEYGESRFQSWYSGDEHSYSKNRRYVQIKRLMQISGIGSIKADRLFDAGYKQIEDLKEASQEELAEVLGNALAARVKADIQKKQNAIRYENNEVEINADELVEELGENEEQKTTFLDQGTLMVNHGME